MKVKKSIIYLVFAAFSISAFHAKSQEQRETLPININDSLSLPVILKQVLLTYPNVIKAQQAIQMAEAAIGMAKSGYYPNIYANAGYSYIDPVPEVSFSDLGKFKMVPNNNYNAVVNISENIYDFEKTARNVDLQESNKELTEMNVELIRQNLTLITSVSYYTLIYLQEAIKIKGDQIETLQKHIDFVTKKEQTGSATQYEVLSSKVRMSNAVNQKVDLETSRQTQQAILNSLLGLPANTTLIVQGNYISNQTKIDSDSLIVYALEHRYEMVIARLKEKKTQLQLRSAKVMENPTLGVFASGGFKNGYFPNLNKITPNFTAGVGLNIPIFDATRKKNTILMANTNISIAQSETDEVSRNISTEVYQNQISLQASLTRIQQSKLQVEQAEEALSLAAISFKTGAITNLDFLDAETALEESRVNLLRAKVDYAINVVRLNISLGRPIE